MREKDREKTERIRNLFPKIYPNLRNLALSFSFFQEIICVLIPIQKLKGNPVSSKRDKQPIESHTYLWKAKTVCCYNEANRRNQWRDGGFRKYESWQPQDLVKCKQIWPFPVLLRTIGKGSVGSNKEGEGNQANRILGVIGSEISISDQGIAIFSFLFRFWSASNCFTKLLFFSNFSLSFFFTDHFSLALYSWIIMDNIEMPFAREISSSIVSRFNTASKAAKADVVINSSEVAEEARDEDLSENNHDMGMENALTEHEQVYEESVKNEGLDTQLESALQISKLERCWLVLCLFQWKNQEARVERCLKRFWKSV